MFFFDTHIPFVVALACFNAAISACARNGRWREGLEILKSIDESGLTPDVMSFSAAISACEKDENWEQAIELLDSMRTRGISPNVICFNAALSSCVGQWERAIALLQSHADYEIQPDVVSFSVVFEALDRAQRHTDAMELMFEARSRGLFIKAWSSQSQVDLHGCSAAVARTVMRCLLQDLCRGERSSQSLAVITGRGKHSSGNAVLPSEVRLFLLEVSGPETTDVPDNPGCFLLTASAISKWRERICSGI